MSKVYTEQMRQQEADSLAYMIETPEQLKAWMQAHHTNDFTLFVLRTVYQPDNYNTYQLCAGKGWDPKEHVFMKPELGRLLDTWDFRFSEYDKMLRDGRGLVGHFSGYLNRGEAVARLERGIDPLTHTINGKERKPWTK